MCKRNSGYGYGLLLLMFLVGCAASEKENGRKFKDESEARNYFQWFQFSYLVPSIPGIGAPGKYLQSEPFKLPDSGQAVHGKINLFLLEKDDYLIEYQEIVDQNTEDGEVFGEFRGTVFGGTYRITNSGILLDDEKAAS